MSLKVKICGITSPAALQAAISYCASYIGLVFFPPSPRFLKIETAARLASEAGRLVKKVGVFVDPEDAALDQIMTAIPLDYIQLHGNESPERVAAIKRRFGKPVIKALSLGSKDDLRKTREFETIADMLMFDSAPRAGDTRPGGNARGFDYSLLQGLSLSVPWLLSGGLNSTNLEAAVRQTGALEVDVSSGVEQNPGHKDPRLIREFLELAAGL